MPLLQIFWDLNVPASRGQNCSFLGFCQYFGLDMVYFGAISLHMMSYNTQTQTNYGIKDRKQKIRKNGNGNVFQNLTKTVTIFFGKNPDFFFTKLTQKLCLIWVSCCIRKGFKYSKNSQKLLFCLKVASNARN